MLNAILIFVNPGPHSVGITEGCVSMRSAACQQCQCYVMVVILIVLFISTLPLLNYLICLSIVPSIIL